MRQNTPRHILQFFSPSIERISFPTFPPQARAEAALALAAEEEKLKDAQKPIRWNNVEYFGVKPIPAPEYVAPVIPAYEEPKNQGTCVRACVCAMRCDAMRAGEPASDACVRPNERASEPRSERPPVRSFVRLPPSLLVRARAFVCTPAHIFFFWKARRKLGFETDDEPCGLCIRACVLRTPRHFVSCSTPLIVPPARPCLPSLCTCCAVLRCMHVCGAACLWRCAACSWRCAGLCAACFVALCCVFVALRCAVLC